MECVACHAPLRAGARFCHVCGARQPEGVPEVAVGVSIPTEEEGSDAPARRPRPPRVPRSQEPESDEEPASTQQTDNGARRAHATLPITPDAQAIANAWDAGHREGADVAEAESVPSPAVSPQGAQPTPLALNGAMPGDTPGGTHSEHPGDHEPEEATTTAVATAEHERKGSDATGTVDAPSSPPSSPLSSPPSSSDAETTTNEVSAPSEAERAGTHTPEDEFISSTESGADATSLTAEAAQRSAPSPEVESRSDANAGPVADAEPPILDSLPWPLVPGLIVGGRYRVEEVTQAARISLGAENTYRATDLRGYESCWSCGAAQGENSAHERYCRVCDSDLLDFPLRLGERLLAPEELAGTDPAQEPEAPGTPSEPVTYPHTFMQGQRRYTVTPLREPGPAFVRGVRVVGALASDVGLAHSGETNEDSASLVVLQHPAEIGTESWALALVADGLGGHSDGQEASRIASRIITEELLATALAPRQARGASISPDDTTDGTAEDAAGEAENDATARDALQRAVARANSALCALNAERSTNMGTTVVAALVQGASAYILWAGDSRAYSFTEGTLRRLTADHSLVEQLVAGGLIAPEERYTHNRRNEVYRSLGTDPALAADIVIQRLSPGMRLLLCSDGLWEMVRDDDIAQILADARHPQLAVDRLVARANEHGGEDNICAVLIEVNG